MRVPIPVVILLVLAVVGGVWWTNTRHLDFLKPPSETTLQEIRQKVESTLPRVDEESPPEPAPAVVKAPEPPPPVEEEKPKIDLGDLTTPPTLQGYGEITPIGPAHVIGLATALEESGEFQRALLAWERVIDLTKPNEAQAATAISAIKRLRPTLPDWNSKLEAAVAIELRAGTGKQLAKELTPILEGVARDLEAASSGVVKVKPTVTAGKSSAAGKAPVPVAIWLTGSGKKPASTEVLSFTVDSPEALRQEVMKTVFQLVRSHLASSTAYTPPAALGAGEEPQSALNFRITRLCWSDFATSLNLPPKKPE